MGLWTTGQRDNAQWDDGIVGTGAKSKGTIHQATRATVCDDSSPKAVRKSDRAVVSMCSLLSAHGDLGWGPCEIEFGRLEHLVPLSMDTLGFEPKAFRMRGRCDASKQYAL